VRILRARRSNKRLQPTAAGAILSPAAEARTLAGRGHHHSMEHTPRRGGRSSAGVPRAVQWFAVVVSTGLSGLLLALLFVTSEYRPSGASVLQQVVVVFAVSSLSLFLSVLSEAATAQRGAVAHCVPCVVRGSSSSFSAPSGSRASKDLADQTLRTLAG